MRTGLLFFCVLLCCSLGMLTAGRLKKRIALLRELNRMAILIRQEILNGRATLPDIFAGLGRRMHPSVSCFLTDLGRELKTRSQMEMHEIFSQNADKAFAQTPMQKQDLDNLKEMGRYLGYLDRDTQIHTLDLYIKETEGTIAELTRQYPEKSRLYRTLGVMGGIMLAVLFL